MHYLKTQIKYHLFDKWISPNTVKTWWSRPAGEKAAPSSSRPGGVLMADPLYILHNHLSPSTSHFYIETGKGGEERESQCFTESEKIKAEVTFDVKLLLILSFSFNVILWTTLTLK